MNKPKPKTLIECLTEENSQELVIDDVQYEALTKTDQSNWRRLDDIYVIKTAKYINLPGSRKMYL
jgi:hypothetical protein